MEKSRGSAPPTVGRAAELACLLEATARKPGNVHPGADFADMGYADFVVSAAAIAPVMDRAAELGIGPTVLRAVQATRSVTSANTNLGMVLLLAPLAASDLGSPNWWLAVGEGLSKTTVADAADVYRAIRLAGAGGLGKVSQQDVNHEPTVTLLEAMRLAADRDAIAAEYACGFAGVLSVSAHQLSHWANGRWSWEDAVINTHLHWMAAQPDSLIARKCGRALAEQAQARAARVLRLRLLHDPSAGPALAELDAWLRADGHRRNPGTSADLTAATLFVALRRGTIRWPWGPTDGFPAPQASRGSLP